MGLGVNRLNVIMGQHRDSAGSILRRGLHTMYPVRPGREIPRLDQDSVAVFLQDPSDPLCPRPVRLRIGDKEVPPTRRIHTCRHLTKQSHACGLRTTAP
jgi:hypothetical protein